MLHFIFIESTCISIKLHFEYQIRNAICRQSLLIYSFCSNVSYLTKSDFYYSQRKKSLSLFLFLLFFFLSFRIYQVEFPFVTNDCLLIWDLAVVTLNLFRNHLFQHIPLQEYAFVSVKEQKKKRNHSNVVSLRLFILHGISNWFVNELTIEIFHFDL